MANMNTKAVVQALKREGEDFEFYPTTESMIEVISQDLKALHAPSSRPSILEIGAGDCRVSLSLVDAVGIDADSIFVIEKSLFHIRNYPTNIQLVGTDFLTSSLIDKEANIVFCNPPYSCFEQWAGRIIHEAFASVIYLIIPSRWKTSKHINEALRIRGFKAHVIATDDFLDADRSSRAKVDVLRICKEDFRFRGNYSKNNHIENDPLMATFSCNDESPYSIEYQTKEKIKKVFNSCSSIEDFVICYDKAIEEVMSDLRAIQQLSPSVFSLLDLDKAKLLSLVRGSIKKVKYEHWQNFFNCYEPITSRLTSKSRDSLLRGLSGYVGNMDFTVSNILAVTTQVINRANQYYEEQIKDLFFKLADDKNVVSYKSNQKVFSKENWRYSKESKSSYFSHCKLDYRIIDYIGTGFGKGDQQKVLVGDLIAIANGLNQNPDLSILEKLNSYGWSSTWNSCFDYGENNEFFTKSGELLFDIKFFKNGNYHLRMSKKFALAFNLALGKILGWIKSKEQAEYELGEEISDELYNSTGALIEVHQLPLLGTISKQEEAA